MNLENQIRKNQNTGRKCIIVAATGKQIHQGVYLGDDHIFKDTHYIGLTSSIFRPNARAVTKEGFICPTPFYSGFKRIKFMS
jgi:hypothetical protein